MKKSIWWSVLAICFFIATLIGIGVFIIIECSYNDDPEPDNVALPIIKINLNDVELEDINNGSKKQKYDGIFFELIDGQEHLSVDSVQISGRGNTTWGQNKKPYTLKFKRKLDLLGIGKSKKWILLANYLDDTQLRNDIAYRVGYMLGEDWVQKGEFVELYINDEYLGLYYLVQKIEISKNSLNLKDPLGVLVELDNLHWADNDCHESYNERCLVVKDLVNRDGENLAIQDFLNSFNIFEIAAESGDYKSIEKVIDVESFAKYYLVSEFTANPDAYNTSWFLYKDGPNDKIHAGVYWDYDLALSNARWGGSQFFLPDDVRVREKFVFGLESHDGQIEVDTNTSKIMYYLMKIPEFVEVVHNVFMDKMCGKSEELLNWVKERNNLIYDVRQRDLELWEKESSDTEVEKLMDWITKRYEHFEKEYGNNYGKNNQSGI